MPSRRYEVVVLLPGLALLWLLAGCAWAQPRSIHQCRDPQGRLIYQDQPCRGRLHRAEDPPPAKLWLNEELGPCHLRSPRIEVPLFAWHSEDSGQPERAPDPLVVGLWLELNGSADGVALRIRGFDPLPDSGMSFDTHITAQGIRTPAGVLIEVDSLDDPGSLRYGFRGSAILVASLLAGGQAQLEVRIRGYQALPARFDLAPVLEAVKRLEVCQHPQTPRSPGQRRLPGKPLVTVPPV